MQPSVQPSMQPTSQPSGQPSVKPFCPTSQPSSYPTTFIPTPVPTTVAPSQPTSQPSGTPTMPTSVPTNSVAPTRKVTVITDIPTCQPTYTVSASPTYHYQEVVTSGTVEFDPDGAGDGTAHDVCDPIQITMDVTFSEDVQRGSNVTIHTPGITSGPCYSAHNGYDIDYLYIPKLLPAATIFNASFVEGTWEDNYYGSYILLKLEANLTAGQYDIVFDRTNRLRRTCSGNNTWPIQIALNGREDEEGVTGHLDRIENSKRKCFLFYSSIVFSQPHQQYATGINVSIHLPFDVTSDTVITIKMDGFTNKQGSYGLNRMTSEHQRGVVGRGSDADLTCMHWNSSSGWTGKWFEGTYGGLNDYTGSYIQLTSTGSHPFRSRPFWIEIGRSCNNIIPVCGKESSSPTLSVEVNSTLFYTSPSPPTYSNAVGRGCDLFNGCNGNGDCDFCISKCNCYEGWGSDTDVEKAGPQATPFAPDCSSKACPVGPAWMSLVQFHKVHAYESQEDTREAATHVAGNRTLSVHGDMECSNHGVCDRTTGFCKCTTGFAGQACERMTCPGTPTCSGRGSCHSMARLARHIHANPLSLETGNTGISFTDPYARTKLVEYEAANPTNKTDSRSWDSNLGHMCVCDSSWAVGLGANQTQEAEFFGPACEFRRCPSGDNPRTNADETDCQGKSVSGGTDFGAAGNKCHVDCSNKGTCDFNTGTCTCYEGWYGVNCGSRPTYEVPDTRRYFQWMEPYPK